MSNPLLGINWDAETKMWAATWLMNAAVIVTVLLIALIIGHDTDRRK